MFDGRADKVQSHPITGFGTVGSWLKKHLLNTAPSPLMEEHSQPTIYILAGPNGAGKTTFANSFLPTFADCREFLNADLIAAGLAPFAPETQAIRASELLLCRIREIGCCSRYILV
jgi:hypothetical protein